MTPIKYFLSRVMGGSEGPTVPPLTEEQIAREGELTNQVQRAVSAHVVACRAIHTGNGRVIALLQESLGKPKHESH